MKLLRRQKEKHNGQDKHEIDKVLEDQIQLSARLAVLDKKRQVLVSQQQPRGR